MSEEAIYFACVSCVAVNINLLLYNFFMSICYIPRANGAKRRSGRKPGARITNSALAFTYIRIMRCYIAQWHSGMKSRPPFWIWTLDGFRRFAHARVITDLKNMADYHQERTLTEGFRKGENKDKNDCHKTTRATRES